MSQPIEAPKTGMQKILDVVEKVGNMVPHPVIIFLILIAIVLVLSAVLALMGTSVSTQVIVPQAPTTEKARAVEDQPYDTGTAVSYQTVNEKQYKIETRTITARSLLTVDGIRFMYSSL